uniref:Ras-associating domain-containing protein n=1 Tax=Glossina pallidipes TaxID=7398 RepID=A0A1A9ZSK0_GLOPL
MSHDRKMLDREAVRSVIQQWNANRLDLFALSEPDENLLFHGVMRFYFQDAGQKVATKCIRVASDATVTDVIDGTSNGPSHLPGGGTNGLHGHTNGTEGENQVAGKLYTELPETSFTRSISNPEAVMRRRRQQKLEKKLQQFRSRDGGPDTGGTLKIYGESLCQDVPYKTLLLSIRDCAQAVVREMLTKYGLEKADPLHYCLVQVNSDGSEYILDDDECPLSILMNHPTSRVSWLSVPPTSMSQHWPLMTIPFACRPHKDDIQQAHSTAEIIFLV